MKNQIAVALLSCCALAGCVQAPRALPLAELRAPLPSTAAPTEAQALEALQAHLSRTLKDPDSVKQFRVLTQPAWATWRGEGVWVNAMDGGWLVCYELNAKNSYGGYTGLKTRGIVFHVNAGRLVPIEDVNWAAIDPSCPV